MSNIVRMVKRDNAGMAKVQVRTPAWYEGKSREDMIKDLTADTKAIFDFMTNKVPEPVFYRVLEGLNGLVDMKRAEAAREQSPGEDNVTTE